MYHINNQYEVKPCGATMKENCPFFGNFGNENHYENFEQAVISSEAASQGTHGMFAGSASSAFTRNRNDIEQHFIQWGLVRKTNPLPEVRSTQEMINKWFSGDKTRYNSFKKIITDKDLNSDTKKDIAILLMRGLSVSTTNNVRKLGENKNNTTNSEITIIEENSDTITQNDLREGNAQAFHN